MQIQVKMEAEKKIISSFIQKHDDKFYENKKLFKANKKRLRKARNCFLSNLKDDNDKGNLSKWESLFGRKDLKDTKELLKKTTKENKRLTELFFHNVCFYNQIK